MLEKARFKELHLTDGFLHLHFDDLVVMLFKLLNMNQDVCIRFKF